jgi:sugar/nucleoside kinase (ribokinase family)
MAYNLKIEGNYLTITDTVTGYVSDRKISEIEIVKKSSTSTQFSVRYRGAILDRLENIEATDFQINGVAVTSVAQLESWKNSNSGAVVSSGGGGGAGQTVSVGSGNADASTTRLVTALDDVRTLDLASKLNDVKVNTTLTKVEKVDLAPDKTVVITYNSNRDIATVIHSSASLSLSYTLTMTYNASNQLTNVVTT